MNRQNIGKSILIVIEALVLCVVLVLGILTMTVNGVQNLTNNTQPSQKPIEKETESEKDTSVTEVPTENVEVRLTFSEAVEEKLASMTTEERVAQMFLITPESLTGVDKVTISGNATKNALSQYPVGGLCYGTDNFLNKAQVKTLLANAQSYSTERIGLSLMLTVEEENKLYIITASTDAYAESYYAGDVTGAVAPCEEMKYDGVLITELQLNKEAVVDAIIAGADMVYEPESFTESYNAVLEAVNNGTISQVRFENAVGRILEMKME